MEQVIYRSNDLLMQVVYIHELSGRRRLVYLI